MTRINCIPPTELHSRHLVAEYRELPRVFALARSWALKHQPIADHIDKLPIDYCLGKGHVMFFYNKLKFCVNRHRALVDEMHRRGYRTQSWPPLGIDHPLLWKDWVPTPEAMELNRQRIAERLESMR